ncbi:MAG: hypothetical protein JWP65_658 [Ramlibacter sp.]|uniref:hypothetical protein n=1 Tax=Ramlibacter sp. TaxID=1917967 RepID=UPI002608CFDD|nr:hypothetical protein [Ramlibacter sp.]MDB5750237.1 hypothetical protein [Ramlibacter sp.]
MTQRSEPMFAVGLAEGKTAPQHQPIASHAPAPTSAPAAPTTSTANAMTHMTPQERDASLLRELATSTVNKALAALNANEPSRGGQGVD